MSTSSGPGLTEMKARMRATWMAGDFGRVAQLMRGAGESFAARLGIMAGERVLDVACGTGNVAIPLARSGAVVTGVDLAPNLLEQARAWAAEEGYAAKFDEGDAEALPYPDAAFDAVVTMFGAMFAPRPEVAVAEMARVLRPGGQLAMGNWTPGGFTGRMFAVGSRYVPPPSGVARPVLWGDEATVRERLAEGFEEVLVEKVPVDFDLPMSAGETVQFFQEFYGPSKMAFAALDETGQAAMARDLEELWAGANLAEDPAVRTVVPSECLLVQARRR